MAKRIEILWTHAATIVASSPAAAEGKIWRAFRTLDGVRHITRTLRHELAFGEHDFGAYLNPEWSADEFFKHYAEPGSVLSRLQRADRLAMLKTVYASLKSVTRPLKAQIKIDIAQERKYWATAHKVKV